MKRSRQFRPDFDGNTLEERVVMSVKASAVPAAILTVPAQKPSTSSAAVTATLNQLHSALLSYERVATNAILYTESLITAGKVTSATASGLLKTYLSNKTSLFFTQARVATGNLPYGSGYNGYVNSTYTSVGDLPSGNQSLYAALTFPTNGTNGPLVTLESNLYTAINNQNYAGALATVNTAAIHSTYAAVKTAVTAYVVNGVKAHDFTYHA